ncbi:type VI secretion system secreted protein VgrG [Paraburkholderia tropica]|uniref:Type VI secretion system secreted protein VgrG n=1 Tax=Paraburkholderia tropica TaxID=92647 RepID=A0ABX5MI83_9BURK|nr:type VI secretion system secreted protein VgrG [Paraburkholderia tropica]PZW77117.1 type VI secretion system secreted protein VgrG [Paraburkholderia tropica]
MPRQSDLRFTFEVINGPRFDVVEFEHEEALSECFTLSVDLFSTDPAVEFGSVLDRPALLTIWRRDMPIRYVHGIVHAFVQGDTGFRRTRYSATIVPELKRAGLYSDWRIHQKANIPQLLESRIKELGITDYEQRMYGEHLTREYCVQPGETTLYFLNRVAAEEGIYLAYSHSAQGHRLIMGDHLIIHGAIAGPVIYNATPGGDQTEPCIRSVTYAEQIRSSRFVQRDYFFRNPRYSQEHRSDGADLQHQGRDYEKFGYPGRYKYDAAGKPMTQTRQLAERRDAQLTTIEGDDARLTPGVAFTLEGHPHEKWNRNWRPVRMVHRGTQHVSLEEESAGSEQGTTYSYTAEIIPDDVEWKAPLLPKPVIDGPQVATVTGPPGEEIYCDEWGRVKVQFPWDRLGNNDEYSSCWIRVAQNWAGTAWGHMAIPRIGQEVIVTYVDGDCDQPLIIGRTYRATNLPPYELPRHKTRMTIKSQTHKGDGYNELRFEDEKNQEEIYVHAQKDQNVHVSRRAISGAHSTACGASKRRVLSVAGHLPSPKRIAKSSPSPARSTRLLFVSSRNSTNGCASRNDFKRGINQPIANVPTTPTVSTSCRRPPSNCLSTVSMRPNASLSTGSSARASSVMPSPRGRRRNSGTPSHSSSMRTCWLTAACVTLSSRPARVKLRWRADASKARSACSGKLGRIVSTYKFGLWLNQIIVACRTAGNAPQSSAQCV